MPIDEKIYKQLLETFREELHEQHQTLVDTLLLLENSQDNEHSELLNTVFRCSHNIKGAAASVSVDMVSQLAHKLEDIFSLWRDKHYKPSKPEINDCLQQADQLLDAFKRHTAQLNSDDEVVKIPLSRIDKANIKIDDFVTYKLQLESWSQKLLDCSDSISKSQHEIKEIDSALKSILTGAQTQLRGIIDNTNQFIGEFSRSIQILQNDLRSMRLVPISTVISPLNRVVHDVSASLGKDVKFEIDGGDIELDKPILEVIKDPLKHLIRNALDHGIESSQDREHGGKPKSALINIKITHESGKIIIKICDDGAGIDIDRVKKTALEKGLIQADILNTLSEEAIYNLLFQAGFSTRKDVTELSGRGVGLDVVQTNLDKIKGTIKVESVFGKGTTFILTVPLTMATTRGLFFYVDNKAFMLPTVSLESLFIIKENELSHIAGDIMYTVNNTSVPVKKLGDILNISSGQQSKSDYIGVLLETSYKSYILLIDDLENEYDCVIKPLPQPFSEMGLYIGVTFTGLGELVLVLNPNSVLELADKYSDSVDIINSEAQDGASTLKKILVVDDSITTRSLAVNALESAGYQVDTAINGADGWENIENNQYDLIITDVEMPVMNGFKLTKMIRDSDQYHSLPIIIVTSLDSDEQRQQGLDAGADSYIVKSEFDTRSLLNIVGGYL